ncbi:MAG: hypothetical protein HYY87_00825 [Candidatus Levybacteria bacterium]|nr:hypothetical protein [Candidatus Levybacteria bacterium]MBI3093062.1 hypothetical protein [Candidatus Levybacteria bacterium]
MARKRYHSHYEQLKNKWIVRHQDLKNNLWRKHGQSLNWLANNVKQLAAGSAAGLLLLTSSAPPSLPSFKNFQANAAQVGKPIEKSVFLITDLLNVLPKEIQSLNKDEEQKIVKILSRTFDLKVSAELDGKRLNRNYGIIGAEQHLARYPGDTMATHFDLSINSGQVNSLDTYGSGMAPGLGAWGYFASSRAQLTEEDKLREKYYIAVQTFLAEDFNKRFAEYRDFYKYRKMLVVNPQNGKAVVAVIGDSGPAVWTGKHLGGSPEVMRYLGREDGARRGPVLYFFIDDPKNQVPLGPIAVQ